MGKKGSKWTDEEIKLLENGYKNHDSVKDIVERLPNRTETAVKVKINKLNLHKKYPNYRTWTEEEVEILKRGYENGETPKEIVKKLPHRNINTIRAKATSMKLIAPKYHIEKWTEEEIEILKKFFLSSDLTYNKEIYDKLPNHTKSSIKSKASELGLSKQRRENIKNELIGKKYGRWTILYDAGVINGYRMVHCICDCGTERDVDLSNLKAGISKSCGCYHDEVAVQNGKSNKKENKYDIESNEYGIGWAEDGYTFLFDKDDYELIKDYCWHKHQDGYLRTRYDYYYDENGNIHNKYIMMHQLLSDKYFNGKLLDHINGRTYDNRKCNLRPAIHLDNSKNVKLPNSNKSGHKGVIQTSNGNWMAYITSDRVRYNLGTFNNYEEAVKVREEAENRYFKEFNREKEFLNG